MKDKLVELIYKSNEKFADCDCTNEEAVEILVDYLLENGVVVMEHGKWKLKRVDYDCVYMMCSVC